MFKSLKELFTRNKDPLLHCDVYKDKVNGSCNHIDGPICDLDNCSILKEHNKKEVTKIVVSSTIEPYVRPVLLKYNKNNDTFLLVQGCLVLTINKDMLYQIVNELRD